MYFTRRELEVLDYAASTSKSMDEIARGLSVEKSNLSMYVKKLERCGLAVTEKKGRSKSISLESGISFGLADQRRAFPTLKLSQILPGRRPFLLAFALGRGEFKLKDIDLPPSSAKMLLSELRRFGLICMKRRGRYALREEAESVARFCRHALSFAYSSIAKREIGGLDSAVFSFDSVRDLEAVFATREETAREGYWPTAFSVAHEYGLKLIQAGKRYYTNVAPRPVDAIVHLLAIDSGSRGITYAAALLVKNGIGRKELLSKRQKFGLGKPFLEGLADFAETRGAFGGITFDEVRRLL